MDSTTYTVSDLRATRTFNPDDPMQNVRQLHNTFLETLHLVFSIECNPMNDEDLHIIFDHDGFRRMISFEKDGQFTIIEARKLVELLFIIMVSFNCFLKAERMMQALSNILFQFTDFIHLDVDGIRICYSYDGHVYEPNSQEQTSLLNVFMEVYSRHCDWYQQD